MFLQRMLNVLAVALRIPVLLRLMAIYAGTVIIYVGASVLFPEASASYFFEDSEALFLVAPFLVLLFNIVQCFLVGATAVTFHHAYQRFDGRDDKAADNGPPPSIKYCCAALYYESLRLMFIGFMGTIAFGVLDVFGPPTLSLTGELWGVGWPPPSFHHAVLRVVATIVMLLVSLGVVVGPLVVVLWMDLAAIDAVSVYDIHESWPGSLGDYIETEKGPADVAVVCALLFATGIAIIVFTGAFVEVTAFFFVGISTLNFLYTTLLCGWVATWWRRENATRSEA